MDFLARTAHDNGITSETNDILADQHLLALLELCVVLLHFICLLELQLLHDDEFMGLLVFQHLALFEVGVAVVGLAGELGEHWKLVIEIGLKEWVADQSKESRFVFA